MRNFALILLGVFFFFGYESNALSEELCETGEGSVVIQIDTKFSFSPPQYNTENFHRTLDIRIDGYHDDHNSGDIVRLYSHGIISNFDSAESSTNVRHCFAVPEESYDVTVIDLEKAPTRFQFSYGPRSKTISIPQLAERYHQLARLGDQRLKNEEHLVVVDDVFSIRDENGPTWLVPLEARIAERSDGSKVLRVKTHNPSNFEIRDTSMSLQATDSFSWCMSTPTVVKALIAVRKNEENWTSAVTDLSFGDLINQSVDVKRGPCGETAVGFKLGDLPPVQPLEDYYISYELDLDEAIEGEIFHNFWEEMVSITINFSGSNVWPQQLSAKTPTLF